MAILRDSAGFGGQSGVLGNVVLVQTEGGTIMRSRPFSPRGRGWGPTEQGVRLRQVGDAWDALDDEAVAGWRTYALERAAESPRGSRTRITSAYSHFAGLGSKYLQLHGGSKVPSRPPTGRFLGDGLQIAVHGGEDGLTFVSPGANREGMVTELLAQPLARRHNAPRPRSYTNLGFVTFEGPESVVLPVGWGQHWACAVRFVEAATGRATGLVEIGTATISASSGIETR